MKIAFVIRRLSAYRQLGPIVDRALELGARVECWHDYSQPREGLKGYLFPAAEECPRFQHGTPHLRQYRGASELAVWLEKRDVDVVVSDGTAESDAAGAAPRNRPLWTCVQVTLDTFCRYSLVSLEACDLVAFHTEWWTEFAAPYYAAVAGTDDVAEIRARLEHRGEFVGFPELDARRLIDPAGVRRRWGIPADQPVVVLLPFPQGVGQGAFWPKKIFAEPSRSRRLLNVALHREFKYWRDAWTAADDAAVVAAVRRFCDRSGAFLLVKSREKTPIPEYTRAAADKCVYDETYYPATILEALSIARLCISYYSMGVVEAAALAVPHVCVAVDLDDYLGGQPDLFALRRRFFARKEQGPFQFGGVSVAVPPEEAIADLQRLTLDDYRVDPAARLEYLRRFLGPDDRQSAGRLIQAIESRVVSAAVR